jgi:hypothetical protein
VVSYSAGVLRVLIVDGEDMTCTFTFGSAEEEQVPTDIFIVADPQKLACGGETELTATLFDQNDEEITGVIFDFNRLRVD